MLYIVNSPLYFVSILARALILNDKANEESLPTSYA